MARRPRAAQIENRTNRFRLAVRRKPYSFTPISPGIALGYRRNRGAGTWVMRAADGRGGSWTKAVGLADDYEIADGEHVLDWFQAIDKGRKLARGGDTDASRPTTVAEAVDAYERDLVARAGSIANAGRIRRHLPLALAAKPVGLLTARELAAWRDSLLKGGMKPATLVRLCKSVKAALTLAAKRDRRITNTAAWRDGLGGIAEDYTSRNVQRLNDDQVHAVIDAAYAVDPAFGIFIAVAAETGARISQIARLTVGDLIGNGTPRLMMPASRKGRGRKPAKRPVPITPELAATLSSNRPTESPLLLRSDGAAWHSSHDSDHKRLYRMAAECAGISGTVTALRHSSIVRGLLAGVPARVVAVVHDTSIPMLERTYSAHVADFADTIARRGLLAPKTPNPDTKVVPLTGRRP